MNKLLSSTLAVNVFVSLIYGVISWRFLITNPPPQPDEAIYADVAITWLQEGRLGTDLWKGMIPKVEQFAAWNPPGYFFLTALGFALLTPALYTQRLISVIFGLLVILLIADLSRRYAASTKPYTWLLFIALVSDYQFMTATRIARPEIVVLALGLLSWWIHLRWRKPFLSGLIAGSAGLFHPLGFAMVSIVFLDWLLKYWQRDLNRIQLKPYLLGSMLPLLTWLTAIQPAWPILFEQFQLASARKYLENPWVVIAFKLNIVLVEGIFICLGGLLVWLIGTNYKKFHHPGWFLTILAVGFAGLSLWGRMSWYTAYALPFLYLAVIHQISRVKPFHGGMLVFVILILINTRYSWKQLIKNSPPAAAYQEYCQGIVSAVPDAVPVFLSGIPEPYYCFIENHRHNLLIEFPVLPVSLSQYREVLSRTNYVVYQGSYETVLFGDFLQRYLDVNAAAKYPVADSTGIYTASVIKLKPLPERTP